MGSHREASELFRAGAARHDARDLEGAVALYKQAVAAYPDFEPVYNDLSVALFGLRRFEEALPYAERAYRDRPNHPPVLSNLFTCLLNLRRPADARRYLDGAVYRGLDPARDLPMGARRTVAEIYWMTDAQEQALPLFEGVLKDAPDDYVSLVGAAVCHYYFHRLESALVLLKRVRRVDPDCAVVCLRMAHCYRSCGLTGMAAKYCRLARERQPDMDLGDLADLTA